MEYVPSRPTASPARFLFFRRQGWGQEFKPAPPPAAREREERGVVRRPNVAVGEKEAGRHEPAAGCEAGKAGEGGRGSCLTLHSFLPSFLPSY